MIVIYALFFFTIVKMWETQQLWIINEHNPRL